LSSNLRTTQTSSGNSRLCSRRKDWKSVSNTVLTVPLTIISGHMVTKLPTLTQV
jgi:hypothetical protein